ncbi:MAG: hypothetical protein N2689_06505 [Verrucomicrobiae bacterium]|nr:hypothetical protein [Verrucomicrobiae bacterium]
MKTWMTPFAAALAFASVTTGDDWNPREPLLQSLLKGVPAILKSQNPQTGRFGTEPWVCGDQDVVFALAAAWAIQDNSNPFHRSAEVLEAIMKGGDALIADQDKNGAWIFRKKDNSTWGQTLMPWTYSRWIRAFALIKGAMPVERRRHWENGLLLGFNSISKGCLGHVHNIPTHHAMALYCAGDCFGRDDWKQQARAFMAKVVAAQNPGGWWSEHRGPVVLYNFVYVDALGVYHALSRDPSVLEALRRAAVFHATFTYPDGSSVETVDERNAFYDRVETGNVGFSFTPEGRGYLLRQFKLSKGTVSADQAASFLLYGGTGPAAPTAAERDEAMTIVGNNEALVLRRKPWFICLSAFVCEPPNNRWQQDRQNFVSIFHDRAGLIVGGGNTKLQPFWSNFTVGDTSLLQHKPGDENPNFRPRKGLIHVPSAATLRADKDAPGLDLKYGDQDCRITVRPLDTRRLTLIYEAGGSRSPNAMGAAGDDDRVRRMQSTEGHITFLPRLGAHLKSAAGKTIRLGETGFEWADADLGEWFDYGAVRVRVPPGARLLWPKKAHNSYKKDGSSTLQQARLALCLPFSTADARREVTIEIGQ